MTTLVTVWLLNDMRPPTPVSAVIHRTPKCDWAIINGNVRRQIGKTAFLTEKSAMQRWQGDLDRIRKSRYVRHAFPGRAALAEERCKVNIYKGSTT